DRQIGATETDEEPAEEGGAIPERVDIDAESIDRAWILAGGAQAEAPRRPEERYVHDGDEQKREVREQRLLKQNRAGPGQIGQAGHGHRRQRLDLGRARSDPEDDAKDERRESDAEDVESQADRDLRPLEGHGVVGEEERKDGRREHPG